MPGQSDERREKIGRRPKDFGLGHVPPIERKDRGVVPEPSSVIQDTVPRIELGLEKLMPRLSRQAAGVLVGQRQQRPIGVIERVDKPDLTVPIVLDYRLIAV